MTAETNGSTTVRSDTTSADGWTEGRSLLRRVANVVVQAIMGSRAGLRIDRGRLLQVIEDRLPELLDGTRLRFQPILGALLRVEGVTERDLYLGIVNLSVQLAQMGIELEPPDLTLDHETRLSLIDEARQEAKEGYRLEREADVRGRIRQLRARKLGDLLVEEGLISGAQLAEALDAQKRFGGRLGTNLVERGHLSEIELAHFLSVQLGVPSVTRLDQIASDAREVLPVSVADRYRVVPARVEAGEVHLAMADPLDIEAIDAASEATGRRVFPVVAPEILISYALERSYGIRRAPRVLGTSRPASHREQTVDEALMNADLTGRPAEETLDLPALGARLMWVETEARVFELVQGYLEQRSSTSAVFIVDGDRVRGWSHRGALVSQHRFRDSAFVYRNHPILRLIAESDEPYVGPGTAASGSQWLTEILGLVPECSILGLPLRRGEDLAGIAVAHVEVPGWLDVDVRVVDMVRAALLMVGLRQEILSRAA